MTMINAKIRQRQDQIAQSIFKMLLAAFSFSVMATFVKYACHTLPPIEVVFFRSLLGSIAVGALMAKERVSWVGKNQVVLVLRGLFGFGALSLFFFTISQLDLGTAVMLNLTSPIFVVILAHLLLKEKTALRVWLAILLSFVGIYLVAAPQFEEKPVPILLGILSGVFAAVAAVLIRLSKRDESPYTIIFYFTAISTIASLPMLKGSFEWPTIAEWGGLFGVTIGAFFGQVFMTRSIQAAPVSIVSPFAYMTPVLAALFGFIFWKEFLSLQAILGSAIIISSGVAIYLLREKYTFVPLDE